MKKIFSLIICLNLIILTSCVKGDVNDPTNTEIDNVAGTTQNNKKTYTGFEPLKNVEFIVNDSENSRGLPEKKIAHSYGVAKDGKPHDISVNSQKFFETNGYCAVTYDSVSADKRLYLTFDCGYENGYTSQILDVLKEKNVKAAFFCTLDDIKSEPELIARMIKEGHIVGNHSASHPSFAEISREEMADEIEKCENFLRTEFGYTTNYFRFPKGEYSESALELIGSLGYKCIFWSLAYSDWDVSNQKGADNAFQKVTSRLHPGAIILLHSVSSDNAQSLGRIIDYAEENGYKFETLDNLSMNYSIKH